MAAAVPILKNVRGPLVGDYYEYEIPDSCNPIDVAQRLVRSGQVAEIFFNLFGSFDATPDDQYFQHQWNVTKVQGTKLWDVTWGPSNVIVAVLDVGAAYAHSDLVGNLWPEIGYDFVSDDSDPYPYDGARHGTAVAGIVGAVANNAIGVAGLAGGWGSGGMSLMHLRMGYHDPVLGDVPDMGAAAAAVTFAAANGAKVINMSFGSKSDFPPLQAAINAATNVLCVASSGNYAIDIGKEYPVRFPANMPNVLAVGALTESDDRKRMYDNTDEPSWGSCFGPELDVVAPGIHIPTTDLPGSPGYSSSDYYLNFGGTSSAAPLVSAVAALIRSIVPTATSQQVMAIITGSADKVPGMGGGDFTYEYGYGRLNAYKAVKRAVEQFDVQSSNDLTIPYGESWVLSPNTTLTFAADKKFRVEGTLSATSNTFSALNGQWYGIEFYNGASDGMLYGCTIENALYGIFAYNTEIPISHCTIQNNSTGVYASSYWTGMAWNLIQDNSPYGIYCANYGDPNLTPSNILRFNGWAVRGDATSQPYLGSYIGYNSLYWNDYYDVYSDYGGTISACGNWWGDYPPYPSVTAYVDYSGALDSDPNGWAKIAAKLSSPTTNASPPEPIAMPDTSGISELDAAYALMLKGQEQEALTVFQSLSSRYSNEFVGSKALVFISRLQSKLRQDVKGALTAAISQHPDTRSAWTAQHLLVGLVLKDGNAKIALEMAEQLVSVADATIAKLALYDAGNICWYRIDDKPRAVEYFTALKKRFPDDPLSISAMVTMGEEVRVPSKQSSRSMNLPLDEFTLLANYPNPFNPSTTLGYQLPEEANVKLAVFDVLGRQVAELASGVQQKGYYSVTWDGTSVASGVYYARFTIIDGIGNVRFTKINKLLLMK